MGKVTTTDIARAAGVSQTTVSVVLSGNERISISEETRRKVLLAAKRLGYEYHRRDNAAVERADRPRCARIGLMMPNLNNLFFTSIVRYVEQCAWQAGYDVVVVNIERRDEREDKRLKSLVTGVDGVIVAYTPRDIENVKRISRELPVVVLGESPRDCALNTIGINGYRCGELMAAHLYHLGHRDIVLFTAPIPNISLTRPRRIEGIRAFFETQGVKEGFTVIEDRSDEDEGDEIYEFEMGYRLTQRLLREGRRFTAIMASDMCAPGIYQGLNQAGLNVPGDVSVVGIDNTFVSQIMSPALTSIDHHLRERCKLAVDRLTENIRAFTPGDGYLVEYSPSLIVRESTGPARGR